MVTSILAENKLSRAEVLSLSRHLSSLSRNGMVQVGSKQVIEGKSLTDNHENTFLRLSFGDSLVIISGETSFELTDWL